MITTTIPNILMTIYEWQFDWGGVLPNGNGGEQCEFMIICIIIRFNVQACLTVKIDKSNRNLDLSCHSDPAVFCGKAVA